MNEVVKKRILASMKWFFLLLLSISIVPVIGSYYWKSITFQYVRNVDNGYEVKLVNNTKLDYKLESLRIKNHPGNHLSFDIVADIYGTSLEDIPKVYSPAFEFKDIDGSTLIAESSFNFIVPSFTSDKRFKPKSIVIDVEYIVAPKNGLMKQWDRIMKSFRINTRKHKVKYAVRGGYWSPIGEDSLVTSSLLDCRDSEKDLCD